MTNPYRIEPPSLISFSGGRTSGYLHGGGGFFRTLPDADMSAILPPRGGEAMRYAPEKVQALRDEIQAWLESKGNDLDHDTHWETADEYFGEKHLTYPYPHYLVLCCGSGLTRALWPMFAGPKALCDEFEEILERHDFWYELEDGATICIMGPD
jgi:hypothetical protein